MNTIKKKEMNTICIENNTWALRIKPIRPTNIYSLRGVFRYPISIFSSAPLSSLIGDEANGSEEETSEAKQQSCFFIIIVVVESETFLRSQASDFGGERGPFATALAQLRPHRSSGSGTYPQRAFQKSEGEETQYCLREALLRRIRWWSDWARSLFS